MPKNKVNNNIKLKSGGGLINGPDGLSVDGYSSMPAYENLVAGDLLKVISSSGVGKLAKIKGIQAQVTQSITKAGNIVKIVPTSDYSRLIILTSTKLYYCANSNGTLSGLTDITPSSGTPNDFCLIDDTHIISSTVTTSGNTKIQKVICTNISGATAYGGEQNVAAVTGAVDSMGLGALVKVDTNKAVIGYYYYVANYNHYLKGHVLTLTGNEIAVGSGVTLDSTTGDSSSEIRTLLTTSMALLSTNKFVVFYRRRVGDYKKLSVVVGTVSGASFTAGGIVDILSGNLVVSYNNSGHNIIVPESNKFIIIYNSEANAYTYIFGSVSSNTITLGATGTSTIGANIFSICFQDRYLYAITNGAISKLIINRDYSVVLKKSLTISSITRLTSFADVILATTNDDTIKSTLLLLDHDEFITSANASYLANANVPITTLFSGFSGLLTGYEYYIKSDASGISGNTTYQKIGVAINDTTILKG